METFLNLLNSYSTIIVVATIMVIAFARCITKIFRMGVTFKAGLATQEELRDFEDEVRKDMRGYAVQIQKAVTESVMLVISEKFKGVEDAKQAAIDVKMMKVEIQAEIDKAMEKYNEMKAIGDTTRQLSNRVQRLEYNSMQNAAQNQNERRRTEN